MQHGYYYYYYYYYYYCYYYYCCYYYYYYINRIKALNIEYKCRMLTNHIAFEIWTLNCEWALLNRPFYSCHLSDLAFEWQ